MRTTLDIDEDVLLAAKERARRERVTTGHLVSTLLRQAMTQPAPAMAVKEPEARYGFRPFRHRGVVVTDQLVDQLRNDEGI
ncbi:MAG: hypothetical protein JJT85_05905 [Chromatiales bacterium]|nr:hypothetical protein [Chromatiales bacterium]